MALTLRSPAFEHGDKIPQQYTCDGENASPPIMWSEGPTGTRSFAIIMDDPDAPGKTWVHWILYNIPSDEGSLSEHIPNKPSLERGMLQGKNDFEQYGYGGPCPPSGTTHSYYIKLYALDIEPDLSPGATKELLLEKLDGHILDQSELTGKYLRQ